MNDVLILTGWGYYDYACAASAALLKFPEAEVLGLSKRRLPEFIDELSRAKDLSYKKVFILGVSLLGDTELFTAACLRLASKSVKLEFISVYSAPELMVEKLSRKTAFFIGDGCGDESLTELVARRFEINRDNTRLTAIIRIACEPDKKTSHADLAWRKLIDAAASRYRRFQDAKTYGKVITFLAKGIAPDERLMAMVEEFNRNGRRELKGKSKAIAYLQEMATTLGNEGRCRVLITGETGTGKETVAYLIHGHSQRGKDNEPFMAFNCADLSPQLLESRLFGHEKGAFTGADSQRRGAFELANGGTLFLDEVGELTPEAQAGLLRVVQEGKFRRLGGEKEIEVDVRIITATNRPIPDMVAKHEFREDLFYRLNVVNVQISPLRSRPEDIEDIANAYVRSKGQKPLSAEQLEALKSYAWPGNVRELENILERSIVLAEQDLGKLLAEHRAFLAGTGNSAFESDILEDVIKAHVRAVVAKHGGNISKAQRALGLGSVNTVKKYIKQD